MILFIDCEGTLTQEFSALYVNEESGDICLVFHAHMNCLPDENCDCDAWARRHTWTELELWMNSRMDSGMTMNSCALFVTKKV